jgi:hypothetical protein
VHPPRSDNERETLSDCRKYRGVFQAQGLDAGGYE